MSFNKRPPETSQLVLINDVVFLDFEASSLKPTGWPIEVGLSRVEADGEIVTQSHLIQRHPNWPMSAWTPEAEAIHGISLETLDRDGLPAERVARWYLSATKGRQVISDAPEFDERWLHKLLWPIRGAVDVDELCEGLLSVEDGVWPSFTDAGQDAWLEALRSHPAPHRAGPDAERMAHAHKAAMLAG